MPTPREEIVDQLTQDLQMRIDRAKDRVDPKNKGLDHSDIAIRIKVMEECLQAIAGVGERNGG